MILWKVAVFNLSPATFISYYSAYFFPPLLIFFIYLTEVFSHYTSVGAADHLGIFYLIILVSVFYTLSLALFSNTFGSFFAVSGALTTLLFFLVSISTPYVQNTALFIGLLMYVSTYSLTLMSTFWSLSLVGFYAGYQHLSSLLTFRLGSYSGAVRLKVFSYVILFLFSFFSGLPPFLTFYIKLYVISYFVNYNLGFWWVFVFAVLLFSLLYFYFKNVRFTLIQDSHFFKMRLLTPSPFGCAQSNKLTVTGKWGFTHSIILFILVTGFAFLADFFLLLA